MVLQQLYTYSPMEWLRQVAASTPAPRRNSTRSVPCTPDNACLMEGCVATIDSSIPSYYRYVPVQNTWYEYVIVRLPRTTMIEVVLVQQPYKLSTGGTLNPCRRRQQHQVNSYEHTVRTSYRWPTYGYSRRDGHQQCINIRWNRDCVTVRTVRDRSFALW